MNRGPSYPWVLKRLGIEYLHKAFGERDRIKRWLRKIKEKTERFHNNVNTRKVKSIEEIVAAIALCTQHTHTKPKTRRRNT